MGRFVRGDIVIVPFPFSDLSNSKKRPARNGYSLGGFKTNNKFVRKW